MNKLTFVVIAALAFAGCSKKAGNSAAAAIAKMSELRDEMCKCKDVKCAQGVSDKMAKWTAEQPTGDKQPKMSDADTQKAKQIGEELGKCLQTAMTPPPATGSDTPAAGSAGSAAPMEVAGLPAECADYKAQVEKLKTCDKMPPKAQEALIKAYEQAVAGWANLPEGAKQGLNTSCKHGSEAVVTAAKAACGW